MTPPILHDLMTHATALRALARQLVGEGQADDVLQEAAVQSMVRPPDAAGPTTGWLKKVVRGVASKHRRAERTRRRYEAQVAPAHAERPDRTAEDADTMRTMTEAVTSLPEPYRQTILMRFLREMTPTEIARATDTPVATVKTRLQRGLEMLRRKLGERDHDWRAALGGAFGLQLCSSTSGTVAMSAYNKFVLSVVVLLPLALFAWWQTDTDAPGVAVPPAAQGGNGVTISAQRVAMNGGGEAVIPVPKGEEPQLDAAAAAGNGAEVQPRPMPIPVKPIEPFMRLDLVGPAAFREAFGETNLGALMASTDGEKVWRPLVAPLDKMWQRWDAGGEDFAATRERVLAYAGRVRVRWMTAPDEQGRMRMFGVFALAMDDHTDFGALRDDVTRPLRNVIDAAPAVRTVAEREVNLLLAEEEVFLSAPMIIDRQLVAFFGEGATLELAMTHGMFALANEPAAPAAPVALHVDLAQLVSVTGAQQDPVVASLFGLSSLGSLDVQLRPKQRHVEVAAELQFREGDRGIFAGLLPDTNNLPAIRARLPQNATPWCVLPVQPDKMFAAIVKAAGLADDGGEAGVRTAIHEELGMHFDDELLAHLGGEAMVLGDLWGPDDFAAFRQGEDLPLGGCIAFSVKNRDAFQRGLDKVLRYLRRHVRQSEVRDVGGVKITKLGTVFVTGLHMAVGQDVFAVAIGEEAVAQLEALVTAPVTTGEPAMPAAVLKARQLAPAGWNAVGLTDLRALCGGQVGMALEMLDNPMARAMGFDFASEETQAVMDTLLPLIKRHALGDLVTMAGYDERCWRLRLVW